MQNKKITNRVSFVGQKIRAMIPFRYELHQKVGGACNHKFKHYEGWVASVLGQCDVNMPTTDYASISL